MIPLSILLLAAVVSTSQGQSALCAPGASACQINWGTLEKNSTTKPQSATTPSHSATPSSPTLKEERVTKLESASPDTGKKSSSAAAQQGDTARKPVSRRSQVRIPVSPKENDYPAQARKTEKDKTLVPSSAATTVSSAFEKPSWWKRNKKWALPTAIGVGALLGVKCAQGGFICGKTELKSNTEVTVIR